MAAVLVPILSGLIFWGFVLGVCILPIYFRYRDRRQAHETVRAIVAQGGELPPELLSAIMPGGRAAPNGAKIEAGGTIVTFLGGGVMVFGMTLWAALFFNGVYKAASIAGPVIMAAGLIVVLIGYALTLVGRRFLKLQPEVF